MKVSEEWKAASERENVLPDGFREETVTEPMNSLTTHKYLITFVIGKQRALEDTILYVDSIAVQPWSFDWLAILY